MCEVEFFSYEMLALAWAVVGSCISVGLVAYNEGKLQGMKRR
jgi:hypothetical protein